MTTTTEPREFMGHTITLNEQWCFNVSGPEFDDSRYKIAFNSYNDAIGEIDKRVTEAAKLAAQNVTLNIQVITEKGLLMDVNRINRTSGNINGVEGNKVYPYVPWIMTAVDQRNKARQLIRDIDAKLDKFGISTNRSYGRMDVNVYPASINRLNEEYTAKLEAAKKEGSTLKVVQG